MNTKKVTGWTVKQIEPTSEEDALYGFFSLHMDLEGGAQIFIDNFNVRWDADRVGKHIFGFMVKYNAE